MSMFDDLLGTVGKIADVASKSAPAIHAVQAGVQTIDALTASPEDRAALYREMAADLLELCATILRATADGVVDQAEQAQIMAGLANFIPGR